MTQTVAGQREQVKRDELIEQLRQQRAAKAAELEAIDLQIQAATDDDFVARVGTKDLRTMTVRERSEVAAKLGPEKFRALVLGGL